MDVDRKKIGPKIRPGDGGPPSRRRSALLHDKDLTERERLD